MRARPRGAWRRITLRRPPPSVASDTSTAIVTARAPGLATAPDGPGEGSRTVGMDPMDDPMNFEADGLESEGEGGPEDPDAFGIVRRMTTVPSWTRRAHVRQATPRLRPLMAAEVAAAVVIAVAVAVAELELLELLLRQQLQPLRTWVPGVRARVSSYLLHAAPPPSVTPPLPLLSPIGECAFGGRLTLIRARLTVGGPDGMTRRRCTRHGDPHGGHVTRVRPCTSRRAANR